MKTLTVHMIANSHLDPVWLWRRPASIDEAINTSRKVCRFLEEYRQFVFTRGEAWLYSVIEKHDPQLFRRIRKYVDEGRWNIVNGWWIQSDCNFPLKESFMKQAEVGKAYFRDKFGKEVTVGYNVDSFGHSAYLPAFLKQTGFAYYVFMRPQKHEKKLPANLFHWKAPSGEAVAAFRLGQSYTTRRLEDLKSNVEGAIRDANWDIGHTMCFYGIGDHGGAVSREEIEWIIANNEYTGGPRGASRAGGCNPDDTTRDDTTRGGCNPDDTTRDGGDQAAAGRVRLIFSDPETFFLKVKESGVELPVVEEELQYHAIGAYSAAHRFRQKVRRTEWLALQAESVRGAAQSGESSGPSEDENTFLDADSVGGQFTAAWKNILFNQFHDIMGGCCIRTAYEDAFDDLGSSSAFYKQIVIAHSERLLQGLPEDSKQRLLFLNAWNRPFNGYLEVEPWLGYSQIVDRSPHRFRFVDQDGNDVPSQSIRQEAASHLTAGFLLKTEIPAGGARVVTVETDDGPRPNERRKACLSTDTIYPDCHVLDNGTVSLTLNDRGIERIRRGEVGAELYELVRDIGITVYEDESDTWSHDYASYEGAAVAPFTAAGSWKLIEDGPLRKTVSVVLTAEAGPGQPSGEQQPASASTAGAGRQTATVSSSEAGFSVREKTTARLEWKISLYEDEPAVRMRLRLYWQGAGKIVKLVIPAGFIPAYRVDGVPGGPLERKMDGREYPVQNIVSLYPGKADCDRQDGDGCADHNAAGEEGNGCADHNVAGEEGGVGFSCISGDFYAADVQPNGTLRVTLLRSPYYAHHKPFDPVGPHGSPVTDQGTHDYDITLLCNQENQREAIEKHLIRTINPVWMSETTKGM